MWANDYFSRFKGRLKWFRELVKFKEGDLVCNGPLWDSQLNITKYLLLKYKCSNQSSSNLKNKVFRIGGRGVEFYDQTK